MMRPTKKISKKKDRQFRLLVEHSPNAIIMADKSGTLVLANPQARPLQPSTGAGRGCSPATGAARNLS
ncbi:MAG: PAS domain S-box protein [Deltaproteobacteria bacterium]|nr:PAS domain S-box protein [Deltaproteobacteria bacterium]